MPPLFNKLERDDNIDRGSLLISIKPYIKCDHNVTVFQKVQGVNKGLGIKESGAYNLKDVKCLNYNNKSNT